MHFAPRKLMLAAALAVVTLAACGDDDNGGTGPSVAPPANVTVTASTSTRATITFNTVSGASSYLIERASGATGTSFVTAGSVQQPASGTTVTFDDPAVLEAGATYRYRIATLRGNTSSDYSAIVNVTTKAAGSGGTVTVSGDITANRTFYADTVYLIQGFVHVTTGATLFVQAGTTIKGDFNTLGSSLFIMRGAKIDAQGTASNPIVFTSSQAVGSRRSGDWGGLVIVGNARINRAGTIDIEGTGTVSGTAPGTNYTVSYGGGTTDSDNSGTLKYVRVEFAGFGPALNQELNAFTFAAVGSGTTMDHLEALAGLDDSFEFFGGQADAKYLVSYESGDDHFDMSEGYQGRLQFLIGYQSAPVTQRTGAGQPSDDLQGIENDGCNGAGCTNGQDSQPLTIPFVSNFTLVGSGTTSNVGSGGGYGMMLRRGTGGYYVNGVLARWPRGAISLRDVATFARAAAAVTPDLTTTDLAVRNVLVVEAPVVFQAASATQFSFDLTANSIDNSASTFASLFLAVPATPTGTTTAADFDWTPAAGSAAAQGGLATFTGRLQTRAGTVITGTSYRGAVNPNGQDKWWQGWTAYARQ